jgi:phosphomannomutase/phosphoglucomutase
MITGSHLDIEQNGIKLCYGAKTLHKEIDAIKGIVGRGEYVNGNGTTKTEDPSDLIASYLERIQRDIRLDHPLKVVVDCQNGATSEIAASVFRELGCEVTAIHCDKEKPYPFKNPDPQIPENLSILRETVLKNNADIGIAFDGDGDRLGVVDENGEHVPADKILVLLAEEVLKQHPGAKVVYDVLCSQTLVDKINAAGGVPLVSKSGHAYVKDLLLENKALLGGEYSGHIFFADTYYGFDDGLYAAARVLDLLSQAKSKLSVLVSSIPKSYSSPEFRPACPDDLKNLIVGEIRQRFLSAGLPVSDVDGARVVFKHGWGIIRASGTEPKLSIRIEADSEHSLAEYQNIFRGYLMEAAQKHQIRFEEFS